MKRHITKAVSMLVAVCFLFNVIPFVYAQEAALPLDIDGAASSVEQALALYQDMYPAGEPQYNCYVFAQDVLEYIFGVRPIGIDYHGNAVSGSNLTIIGRYADDTDCGLISGDVNGEINEDNLRQLFSLARVGDIVQGIGKGEKQHTMVLQSADEDGIVVYHGNYLGAIAVTRYTYADIERIYGHVVTLYRSSNYDEVNKVIEMNRMAFAFAESYTVTFDANGGIPSGTSKTVTNGGIYGKMPKPAYDGYTFAGWFTAVDGGERIIGSTTVNLTGDQTLYAHWKKNAAKYSRMTDGKIGVVVAGSYLTCSKEPIIEDDRTLVPLRDIFEAIGAEVRWDDTAKAIQAVKDNTTVELKVGSDVMVKNNDKSIVLYVPVQLIDNTAYVPVRVVAEAFGSEIVWSDSLRTIFIDTYDL